jgi:hypothetical protein
MIAPLSYSSIRDNHTRGSVAQFLKGKISPGSALSIVSAYFTIHAYEALAAELGRIQELRFLAPTGFAGFAPKTLLASLCPGLPVLSAA